VLLGSPEPPSPYVIERVFTNLVLRNPLYTAPLPGTNRLWIVQQGGEPDRPSLVLSVTNRDDIATHETVLTVDRHIVYGLTFHPGFASNRWVYVFINGPNGAAERTNRIQRFTVEATAPHRCDPASVVNVLEWASTGHDGGDLAFGHDGMLYITSGDGSSDSDTFDSGQDVSNLLATLIRIDVDHPTPGRAYSVPADNPFLQTPGARPEIWAYGFRNPFRLCVDEKTGDIWVGQNGQDLWETAHLVRRGDNYGWSVFEGSHPFHPHRRRGPTPIVPPTIEHSHADFRSLTGGVVYYGDELPDLRGTYVYGDYGTGKIWGARHRDGRLVWQGELVDTALQIVAFRVDQRGRLLVVDIGGGLYRLVPRPPAAPGLPFPTRLSETRLFESVARHVPAPGLVPYDINAPGWADGARAQRFLALPGSAPMQYAGSRAFGFPNDSVLVQTLSLPRREGDPSTERRLETRLMIRQDGEWSGYSYRWNEDQTDAVLVPKEGEDFALDREDSGGKPFRQPWRIPSRAECLGCHSRAIGFVLSVTEPQLNRAVSPGGSDAVSRNQLSHFAALGLLKGLPAGEPSERPALVNPYDASADLDRRARSYLHANCAVCHVAAGGGNSRMEFEITQAREAMNLIESRPQHDTFGLPNAMLVAPGHPEQSVLIHRLSRRGRGQMPPLFSHRVDNQAVALMRDWVSSMPPSRKTVRAWTVADLTGDLPKVETNRSREAGRKTFQTLGCIQCHRLENQGGNVGPSLDGLATRLPKEAVLESLLEPSRTIADAYVSHEIELRDGEVLTGRIERETATELFLRTGSGVDALQPVPLASIVQRTRSKVSNMPAGMLDVLEKEEILDLLAYVLAGAEPGRTNR
jgi:uncharacterized repeat protein (TIGR03806 family)